MVRSPIGHSADFCPICRAVTCVLVKRVSRVSHLYYIPLSKGVAVGFETSCWGCGSRGLVNGFSASSFEGRPDSDAIELLGRTRPGCLNRVLKRMEVEDRAARGDLTPGERAALLAEPFLALDAWVYERRTYGRAPGVKMMIWAGAIVLAVSAVALVPTPAAQASCAAAVVGLSLLAFAIYAMWNACATWFAIEIHPRLARALAPLRPRPEEIAEVLTTLRKRGALIVRHVNADQLVKDVCSPEAN